MQQFQHGNLHERLLEQKVLSVEGYCIISWPVVRKEKHVMGWLLGFGVS